MVDFYIKETNICNYKVLSFVFKLVLVLSHGQTAVERGFSVKNKVLNVNMHEISITSRKLIVDHMNSQSFATVIPNAKSLLKLVRCSQQRYQEFLREKESLRKQNAQYTQLAIIDREIEEVKDSIAESTKISKNFHAEFPRLPEEAEKKRNFELLSKGNALKRKSQEKQDEASKLEEALQVLQEKRRKIM